MLPALFDRDSSRMTICWSTPVPIMTKIPTILGKSRFHFIAEAIPNKIMISGPKGIDYSLDLGETFTTLDTLNYWAVDLHPSGFGFASGTDGKVIKIIK